MHSVLAFILPGKLSLLGSHALPSSEVSGTGQGGESAGEIKVLFSPTASELCFEEAKCTGDRSPQKMNQEETRTSHKMPSKMSSWV